MDRIILKGELKPDFKLKSVKIKGSEARITDNSFETGDIQLKEGMNSMLIELTDVNGRRRLVSYAVVYEPKPSNPGGGSPIITLDMTAEGYTAPAQKKLSTRTIRRAASVSAPTAQTNPNLDVIFSSPYANQVITEDKLKIGGRFNKDAGIASITVNGQACTLDPASGTFEGPILLSPEEARSKKVNCDSKDYILMKVDPVYHSGKNELKVKVTPAEGKPYEDRVIYYYYQLYVGLNTYGKTYTTWQKVINDDGSIGFVINGQDAELPYSYTQSYNKNMFTEPPFFRWEYEDHNGRALNYDYSLYFWTGDLQGRHWYYDIPAFYFAMDNYWNPVYYESPVGNIGPIRTINDTKLVVHTPPLEGMPFIIKLGKCEFLETSTMFTGVPELDIKDYRMNGISFRKLCGDFERREGGGEEDIAYIVIDDYKPDVDMELKLEAPLYETCFDYYILDPQGHRVSHANTCNKYFYATVEDGIRGDILVDSNNDGFLGGEDNAVEQNEPGCVFWVNDDDDYDEMDGISPYNLHFNDNDAAKSDGNDGADQAINGIRDLEDFIPINIAIPNIKEWTDTQNVRFYLRTEGNSKIRLFERVQDTEKEGELSYLKKIDKSIIQYKKEMKFILLANEKEGQLLDPSWFNSDGKFYGIYEGVSAGTFKIILEVEIGTYDDKKRIILDEAVVTFKSLNDMYKFCNVRYNTLGYGTVAGTDRILVDNKYQGTEKDNSGVDRYLYNHEVGAIYPENPQKIFIWTHGYYNDAEESKIVIDTIFKRMYRAGYRGAFIGVTWHAHEGWTQMAFNADWINSFQSGQIIADIIKKYKSKYPNATISLSAHSLGNNALCYALRYLSNNNTSIIDDIILAEAAMPAESFSAVTMYKLLPFGTIEYMDHYFEDIYGIDTGVIKGKIYNTYSTNDEVLGRVYPLNISMSGLETPLDYNYELCNNIFRYRSIYDAAGFQGLINGYGSSIANISVFSNAYDRPYGIRRHGSMMDEYYYDVQNLYKGLVEPRGFLERKNDD